MIRSISALPLFPVGLYDSDATDADIDVGSDDAVDLNYTHRAAGAAAAAPAPTAGEWRARRVGARPVARRGQRRDVTSSGNVETQ